MNPTKNKNTQATMDTLHARLASISENVTVLENVADSEQRSLTEVEVKQIQQYQEEFAQVEAEISAREASLEMSAKIAAPQKRITNPPDVENIPAEDRVVAPRAPAGSGVQVGDRVGASSRGAWGFRSLGEFAVAASRTARGQGDARILNAPTTYGQEAVGADGGFAVPPDFRSEIMKTIQSDASLFAQTDQQVTAGNSIVLPQDVATPWQTSGGVLGGWSGEGQAITQSKPSLTQLECKANKLTALVSLTDELLQDVPAMTRWLSTKVPEKFNSLLNTAIISGSGVGQPQGILNAVAKITVAAESGQGAGTVVAKNVMKMWSRLYGQLRPGAVWLINQDVEPQLQSLVVPGTTPAFPAYMPPGGLSGAPYATLFGRPIIPIEACSTVGTEGDIILANLKQYLTVMKTGGMRSDVSIHLFFDTDHVAFRFVMRVGGQSYWPAAIARQNGSNTLSPFITLHSTRT